MLERGQKLFPTTSANILCSPLRPTKPLPCSQCRYPKSYV
jgi:hypothetical protein